jgi:chromosome segregation protein
LLGNLRFHTIAYIKRLVMKGFKSFARETTINLDPHMNIVVGPNGSGKSNVTDALCFVLGRLSIKSMRAAKASHLIFSGNKFFKSSNKAHVEIIFDNKDKTFALDNQEISIKRIVKKNGQSIYKINENTKTRQEVIELLSHAGIDPHGFNIILQGEIQRFVKMNPEERRKVIEEVAGISVYEMRKEKSLKELDRTNEKLKQINAVLRERTNYLRNLENEREQALRFKKLQETVKRCKASIINKNIQEKEKESKENQNKIETKKKEIKEKEMHMQNRDKEINILNQKVDHITKTIQQSSGLEQDTLAEEISTLKQETAGLIARKENFENQLIELNRRKQSLEETINMSQVEIQEMSKERGKNKKQELESKKQKLEELDNLKRQYLLIKSNISTTTNQIQDKERQIQRLKNESNFIVEQIEQIEKEIKIKGEFENHAIGGGDFKRHSFKGGSRAGATNNKMTFEKRGGANRTTTSINHHKQALIHLNSDLESNKQKNQEIETKLIEKEKIFAVEEQKISEAEKIKKQVSELDTCPLCKTNITEKHIKEVKDKSDKIIQTSKQLIQTTQEKIKENKNTLSELKQTIAKQAMEINTRNIDIVKLQTIEDKKQQLKRDSEQIQDLEKELKNLKTKKQTLENQFSKIKMSEEDYEKLKLEVNELERTEERNLGAEITTKQRELERIKLAIKQNIRDKQEITEDLKEITITIEEKQEKTNIKESQADKLKNKYQKMFEEKNILQDKSRILETELMKVQNNKRLIENDINNLMIIKAQITARIDTFKQDLEEFADIEFISLPLEKLKEKLNNSENTLNRIGNVNLRALEVYEGIKEQYDKIKEKVNQLDEEKLEILKIIEQIDKKKKKAFLTTLKDINTLFSRNFSQLSTKGIVTIEPQDKKDVFEKGLNIIVRMSGRKIFDVTSLSGGEQTLVALSLIFAIQELKPYCFYIFDEIDAALDRRNSEKLAYLFKKNMKQGQYIVITHNDSIISESSDILYGVSMQEGISKVLSIEI